MLGRRRPVVRIIVDVMFCSIDPAVANDVGEGEIVGISPEVVSGIDILVDILNLDCNTRRFKRIKDIILDFSVNSIG